MDGACKMGISFFLAVRHHLQYYTLLLLQPQCTLYYKELNDVYKNLIPKSKHDDG